MMTDNRAINPGGDHGDSEVLLKDYMKDYWEFILSQNPTFATYIGDHRYDDALEDLSEDALSRQVGFFRELHKKTEAIETGCLSREGRLNHRLLLTTLTNHITMHGFRIHYLALDHLRGPHIDFPQLIEFHPFVTARDIDNYLHRLRSFPRLIHQVVENLKQGAMNNITLFQGVLDRVLQQVSTLSHMSPDGHPLFSPALILKAELAPAEKEDFLASLKEAISASVTPAYLDLHTYLDKDYRCHAREQEGIWSLPDGPALYRFLVEYHTTTKNSPEEIHDIGKAEVERIRGEISRIMDDSAFRGSVRAFAEHLRKQQDLYPASSSEILEGYRQVLSRMDARLPQFFRQLPRAAYDIKEIEEYRQQAAPAAYYYPPPRDFSRPGYFYVNTYKPEVRPKFLMEALAYHEAVPGHHLQICLMQEKDTIPDFRRHEGSTAFIEGWALYAEKLAGEMGFYDETLSGYGRLTFELWRAVRLVVDTGLHCFQWNRDRSIRYCRENTGLEDHEIAVEIDRYIALPGQALAYKMGELKILEMKESAKERLGPRYSIQDFHDRLLENGALPLTVLQSVMEEWPS